MRSAAGQPLAEDPPDAPPVPARKEQPDGDKTYYWRSPDGKSGLNGTRLADLPLYGSEQVESWHPDDLIVLVEGEKARDALDRAGLYSLATVTGASGTPGPDALKVLRGRRVCLWADNDAAGREHMDRIARALEGVAVEVLMYTWHEAPEKGDAADHPAVKIQKRKALDWLLTDLEGAPSAARAKFKAAIRGEDDSANYANTANGIQNKTEALEPEPWTPPAAFYSLDLPEFPRDILPEWMSDYTEALAGSTQSPRDLAGMLGITVGAVACAKLVEVEPWPGWTEPTNLFTNVALKPGTRKSEVFRQVCAPIVEHEAQLIEDTAEEVAETRTRYRVYEGRLKAAEQKASKASDEELDTLTADAMQAAADLASIKPQADPKLLVDDASPERLATILAEQGGRVALLSPEGGVFDMMAGRYSQGVPNLDVYLKGHAGDDIRIDRVSRPSDRVKNPALTTGLAVQPDVLRGLANKPGFRGRGLLGRYLYAIPRDTLGARQTRRPAVDPKVVVKYRGEIRSILGLSPSLPSEERKPHTLYFDPDAQDEMERFVNWVEPQLAEGAELGDMTDWAGKLAGAVARIAGILHMLDHAGENTPWEHEVSEGVVKRAIRVGKYLIPHAKYSLAYMGSDPVVEDAKYVLRWIERSGREPFTKRDAFEGTKSRFGKVSELEPALSLLVAHGYIREDPKQIQPQGPGRKPSPRYEVNPYFKSEHASHNSENGEAGGDDR